MTDLELLLSKFSVARQKILADFQEYINFKHRLGCKHYYADSCPHFDDACDCESGEVKKFNPAIKYNCFEAAQFHQYFEIMEYDEEELAELELQK